MEKLKRYRAPITKTLTLATYEIAIKEALAGIPVDMPFPFWILRLPQGAAEVHYAEAAKLLAQGLEEHEAFEVLVPDTDRKGRAYFEHLFDELGKKKRCILVIEAGMTIPPALLAACDGETAVSPVLPSHLRKAAVDELYLVLSDDDAQELLRFPLDLLFQAMRPGRPIEAILERLMRSKPPESKVNEQPKIEDLGGYGEAKFWALQVISDINAWREGRLLWSDIDTGLLLSGLPGTGKTLFAGALARSCDMHFVATSVATWQAFGHLGDLLGAMHRSFTEARKNAPSLLFIDEFDSVGDRAKFSQDHAGYMTQVVNGLLELLDGSTRLEGVIVVGATNCPDKVDPALLRPGRLGKHVHIGLPGFADRFALARFYFGETLSEAEAGLIAEATEGMTPADFAGVAKDVRRHVRVSGEAVCASLVLSCLPPAMPLVGEDRWICSIHEAGHAIVGLSVGYGDLQAICIVKEVRDNSPFIGTASFTTKPGLSQSRKAFLDAICMILGGIAAERLVNGSSSGGSGSGDFSDLARATDLATQMVLQFGMGDRLQYMKAATATERDKLRVRMPEVRKEVSGILAGELSRAMSILRTQMVSLREIARHLNELGSVRGDEVQAIIRAASG